MNWFCVTFRISKLQDSVKQCRSSILQLLKNVPDDPDERVNRGGLYTVWDLQSNLTYKEERYKIRALLLKTKRFEIRQEGRCTFTLCINCLFTLLLRNGLLDEALKTLLKRSKVIELAFILFWDPKSLFSETKHMLWRFVKITIPRGSRFLEVIAVQGQQWDCI